MQSSHFLELYSIRLGWNAYHATKQRERGRGKHLHQEVPSLLSLSFAFFNQKIFSIHILLDVFSNTNGSLIHKNSCHDDISDTLDAYPKDIFLKQAFQVYTQPTL